MSTNESEFPSTHTVPTATADKTSIRPPATLPGVVIHVPGMTLRDWFAGQALAGMMSHPNTTGSASNTAAYAYEMADAMMKAREG